MKRILTAVALTAAATSPSYADPIEFFGGLTVFQSSGACPDFDPVGERLIARYRPPIPGTDNPNQTILTLFQQTNARAYRRSGPLSFNFQVMENMQIGGNFGPDDARPGGPEMRLISIEREPDTINTTVNTVFMSIVGEIRGYDFMPNCVARFRLAVGKRPTT
jgi:hypothetical protein